MCWLKLFVRLKSEIISCQGCGTRGYAGIFKQTENDLVCPGCGHVHPLPKVIAPNGYPVLLFPGVKLLKGHTDNKSGSFDSEDYLVQTGVVIQNPKDPGAGVSEICQAVPGA
jgi:hypothetical protein